MNRTNQRFSIWYIFGPIVIYWLIGIGVQMAAGFGYVFLNAGDIVRIMSGNDVEEITKLMSNMNIELLRYTTEMTAVAALVMLPVGYFMFRADRQQEVAGGLQPPEKASFDKYIFIFIMAIALCIGLNNLLTLSSVASISETYQNVAKLLYTPGLITQIVCLVIIVPIAEELVYRGLLYKRLGMIFSQRRALVLSALIFGLAHGNIVQFIYAMLIGLLMGFLYDRYGSLKAPVFAHMVMNLVSVVGTKAGLFSWIFYSPLRMGVVTVFCAVVASTMYVIVQREILQKC